jgi:predicted enzyme related to lactoylglutathione lyase
MDNNLSHFAINADDVERARSFYQSVFDWRFQPWGPPGFYRIDTGSQPGGALQERRELRPGHPTIGFECTVTVDDVDAVAESVVRHGGTILMEKSTIAGVGELIFFADPEGNVVGAMRHRPDAE